MTDGRLDVYIHERLAGSLVRARDRSVTFVYDAQYADDPETTALSLSMPKSRLVHSDDLAGSWLANLLPDGEKKLERIAASVGTRSIQPFDLLARIGHDVAGAVQVFAEGKTPQDDPGLVERAESHIADELRGLRADPDYVPNEFGRWSLAGQQGKIALVLTEGRWYAPTGTAASTHILKIGPDGIADGDLAEFVTLRAAHFCGIRAPFAWLHRFVDQLAVVVERYDRYVEPSRVTPEGEAPQVRRIHQEDMCQVLGVRPGLKYQSDGGPSAKEIADALWLLPARSREVSVQRFAQLLIFNALTYSPDAHAKNYSVLLQGSEVTFAPAYDLMSNAVRLDLMRTRHETKLAMKTAASNYEADRFTPDRLAGFGAELRLPADWLVATARHLSLRIGAAFDIALDEAEQVLGANDRIDSMRQHAAELDGLLVKRWA
ncbi:HipA domain-containing protein [Demequina sp. TTPB684]|uniref:HipA domain-containing protein n=1 Tax=unclassified Demequina TaxID=2620311 RepID=UPI001CF48AD4|nr:HipA domain-containing protein [Demequina sp. TMPB413]MCB2413937.1 HipA domain-containing protein [Demequina sp. TTPB684]UPU88708.1 HipA domain-containing protein [Demequina sp. TMPB413]